MFSASAAPIFRYVRCRSSFSVAGKALYFRYHQGPLNQANPPHGRFILCMSSALLIAVADLFFSASRAVSSATRWGWARPRPRSPSTSSTRPRLPQRGSRSTRRSGGPSRERKCVQFGQRDLRCMPWSYGRLGVMIIRLLLILCLPWVGVNVPVAFALAGRGSGNPSLTAAPHPPAFSVSPSGWVPSPI